jgi:hypothetical protein
VDDLDPAGLLALFPASDQVCAMVREHRLPFLVAGAVRPGSNLEPGRCFGFETYVCEASMVP